jgi:very-short-patch-repair endonuclease
VNDQLARHPGRPGSARLRELIATPLQPPTENDLEERFLLLWRATGLPEPRRQMPIDPGDGGSILRPDFVWPEQRVIVETDGRSAHGTRRAFDADRRRDQRLMVAGWTVIRVTWIQLRDAPGEVVAAVSRLLAAAQAGAPTAGRGWSSGEPSAS